MALAGIYLAEPRGSVRLISSSKYMSATGEIVWNWNENHQSRLQRVAPCLTTMGLVKRTNKISAHTKDERFEVGYSSIMSNVLRMSQPQESK